MKSYSYSLEFFWADGEKNWAGPDNWNSKYGTNAPPADWDTYLAEVENQIANTRNYL